MAYGTYDKHVFDACVSDAGLASALALEAGAGAVLVKTMVEPVTVTRFGFRVMADNFNYDTLSVKGVLGLYKYPGGPGDVANKVKLGEINLENGYLAYNVYYVDVDNKLGVADINAGEAVAIHIDTAAVGGTEVGDFQPFFCANPRAEVVGNQTLMHDVTPAVVTGNGANDA
jgi:hypothetical protein